MYINIFPSGYVTVSTKRPYYQAMKLTSLPHYPVIENKEVQNDKATGVMYENKPEDKENRLASLLTRKKITGTATIVLLSWDGHMFRWSGFSAFGVKAVIREILKDGSFSSLNDRKAFTSARATMVAALRLQNAR